MVTAQTLVLPRTTVHVLHEIMYELDRSRWTVTAEDHRTIHSVRADELRDELYAVLHNGRTIDGQIPARIVIGDYDHSVHCLIKPETADALVEAADFALSELDGVKSQHDRTEQWRAARQEVIDTLNGPPPVLFKPRTD